MDLPFKRLHMKLEIPERKKLVHQMVIPIRWGDMDAMAHVNNTVYFRYMETVRLEWFEAIGVKLDPHGQGPVILNAFCNFHRALVFPGQVRVKMYASDPGRSTFETWVTMAYDDQPEVFYATGGATTIWADMQNEKSVPLPEHIRQLVTA
jgi:acyl-CoA thioester hydrolase